MGAKIFYAICYTISTVAIVVALYFTVQTTRELNALEAQICAMTVGCATGE